MLKELNILKTNAGYEEQKEKDPASRSSHLIRKQTLITNYSTTSTTVLVLTQKWLHTMRGKR